MTNKVKIILIIILIIAIGLLAVFAYLSRKNSEDSNIQQNINVNDNQNQDDQNIGDIKDDVEDLPKIPVLNEEEKEKAQLTKMAIAFAERFGSYSNQSNYENIEDLQDFMTNNFKKWAENYVSTNRAQARDAVIYYGMTSKVLKSNIIKYSPTTNEIKFKLSLQRQEVVGSIENSNIFYQDIKLTMIKQGGIWKVDSAFWE